MDAPTEPHIYKSNALIEASYRLNLQEQRIILACIAQVNRSQPITDERMYRVTAKDLATLAGSRPDSAYKELKSATETLFDRRLTVYEEPNGGRPEKMTIRWVQSVKYKEQEGCVEIRFGKDILPYLTELTRRFTRYALSDVARMSSSHAIRLYELLMQWRDTGTREIGIDWMRQRLGIEDKYPAYKDLRRYVIEPAVKQINAHSPIRVKWEARKTGRKVTHLAFSFTAPDKPPASNGKGRPAQPGKACRSSDSVNGVPKALIEQRAKPGESYEDCARRLLGKRARAQRAEGEATT
ncbi:replication initiation protein [Ectothiorhodospira haloalkaliphila]|uniref:replication initiation protein n=1 Tax=Ectothiorhodospira haloalkaliphila TaxID=421628 RepID=UPI001EE84394|nr:replication initiation protein [Ectothiorhodospira haloalkaliphila]MCG5526301.1 replication initiation protein [Ectothiorhodospira haloalkaliphila]